VRIVGTWRYVKIAWWVSEPQVKPLGMCGRSGELLSDLAWMGGYVYDPMASPFRRHVARALVAMHR
jgi:hypothetical protein